MAPVLLGKDTINIWMHAMTVFIVSSQYLSQIKETKQFHIYSSPNRGLKYGSFE